MTDKYCVLVSEQFRPDPNSKTICEKFDVVWWDDFVLDPAKFQEKIQGVFPVSYTLSESMVASMPRLKAVSAFGVGYNHLDVGMFNKYGVKVGNTPGVLNDCTADQVMALMLATARKLANGERIISYYWPKVIIFLGMLVCSWEIKFGQ